MQGTNTDTMQSLHCPNLREERIEACDSVNGKAEGTQEGVNGVGGSRGL